MKNKIISAIICSMFLTSMLIVAFNIESVKGHSGDTFSAWASVTPIMDGVISPGEWDDADTATFTIGIPWGIPLEYHDCTLYVKNDGTNLYLAWIVRNEDFDSGDLGRFHFDNDNDGVREVGDDAINCFVGTGNCRDDYLISVSQPLPYYESPDTYDSGTDDVVGALSHTNPITNQIGDYTFEVSHTLDTADDSHDFSLSVGDTVGLDLEFFDEGIGAGVWPAPHIPASGWADIVIAESPVVVPVAEAGPNQTVNFAETVEFNGSDSYDPDGTIVSYEWDFGDGETGSGVTTTHDYGAAGDHTVTLTVTDDDGASSSDTTTVHVRTPEERTQKLVKTVDTYDVSRGTKKSLKSKLEEAIHLLNPGNEIGAIHKLMDFISNVEALKDKKLTLEQANYLITEAQGIINQIKK